MAESKDFHQMVAQAAAGAKAAMDRTLPVFDITAYVRAITEKKEEAVAIQAKVDDLWGKADSKRPDILQAELKKLGLRSKEERTQILSGLMAQAIRRGNWDMMGTILATMPEAKDIQFQYGSPQVTTNWQGLVREGLKATLIAGGDAALRSMAGRFSIPSTADRGNPDADWVKRVETEIKDAQERMGHKEGQASPGRKGTRNVYTPRP